MGAPTRFVNGVTTAAVGTNMGMFPLPDPTEVCVNFQDFNNYAAADYTVVNTTSHYTIGKVAGAGGILSIVGGGSTAQNDYGSIVANPLEFNLPVNAVSSSYPPTKRAWFYGAIKATVAATDQLVFGATSALTTVAPSDGIYFAKAGGSSAITFVVRKSSSSLAATAYSTGSTTVATLADNTWVELGWFYDGKGNIDVFVNEAKVCSVDVGVSSGTVAATFPQAVALGTGLGIKAIAASPSSPDVICDFSLLAQDRPY